MDLLDDPGHFEGEVGAFDGPQAADRLDLRLPILGHRHYGRDGLRRRRRGGHELLDHGVLERLKAEHAAENQSDRNQHDYHALGHSTVSVAPR